MSQLLTLSFVVRNQNVYYLFMILLSGFTFAIAIISVRLFPKVQNILKNKTNWYLL